MPRFREEIEPDVRVQFADVAIRWSGGQA